MIDAEGYRVAVGIFTANTFGVVSPIAERALDIGEEAVDELLFAGELENQAVAIGVRGCAHTDSPEAACMLPLSWEKKRAVLGQYEPRTVDLSIARFTVQKSLEFLAREAITSVYAHVPRRYQQAAYQMLGFAGSSEQLYICSTKMRRYAA